MREAKGGGEDARRSKERGWVEEEVEGGEAEKRKSCESQDAALFLPLSSAPPHSRFHVRIGAFRFAASPLYNFKSNKFLIWKRKKNKGGIEFVELFSARSSSVRRRRRALRGQAVKHRRRGALEDLLHVQVRLCRGLDVEHAVTEEV